MRKLKIKLVSLGDTKSFVSLGELEKHRSQLFSVSYAGSIGALPNAEGDDWNYPDSQLRPLIVHDSEFDITVAIIQSEVENNYYIRRLTKSCAVVSLYDIADYCKSENIPVENFVLRCVYEIALLYIYYGGTVPLEPEIDLIHHETRGCLFDMNPNKIDILRSCVKPIICTSCSARLNTKQLPVRSVEILNESLSKIRKTLYFRIADWVKLHPLLSIALTIAGGAMSSALGRAAYEICKFAITNRGA